MGGGSRRVLDRVDELVERLARLETALLDRRGQLGRARAKRRRGRAQVRGALRVLARAERTDDSGESDASESLSVSIRESRSRCQWLGLGCFSVVHDARQLTRCR